MQSGNRTLWGFIAFSASTINFCESLELIWYHCARKSSTASRLSEKRCKVLINATTSARCNRFVFECGLNYYFQFGDAASLNWTYSSALSSISKSTFIAVARPVICTFPHRRHLSQPTQSIILETFRKCVLNSSLRIYSQNLYGMTLPAWYSYLRWRFHHGKGQIHRTFRLPERYSPR